MSNPTEKPNLSHLSKNWNSTIITRSNVEKWTGGLITAGYIANLDAKGEGTAGQIPQRPKNLLPSEAFLKRDGFKSQIRQGS